MTPEQRLNRLERIALLFAKSGFRVRKKVSEHDVSLKAIIDAQILTEDRFIRVAESLVQLAESQAQLAESQAHSDRRMDALIEIVRQRHNGSSNSTSERS